VIELPYSVIGKISTFGGPDDEGMAHGEGLALYEHEEANLRKDLFLERSQDWSEGTSKRLKPGALYFAFRFPEPQSHDDRLLLQRTAWIIKNPANGFCSMASLVDWGTNIRTGRSLDLSPALANLLRLKTDDEALAFRHCYAAV
jgi:hypothetical protein